MVTELIRGKTKTKLHLSKTVLDLALTAQTHVVSVCTCPHALPEVMKWTLWGCAGADSHGG